MRRMDASGYAACFNHEQLALMCANSDRTIDRLGAENQQLKVKNVELRKELADVYALHWNGLDCTECPWFDECNTVSGCPWLGILADHMRSLGIEAHVKEDE